MQLSGFGLLRPPLSRHFDELSTPYRGFIGNSSSDALLLYSADTASNDKGDEANMAGSGEERRINERRYNREERDVDSMNDVKKEIVAQSVRGEDTAIKREVAPEEAGVSYSAKNRNIGRAIKDVSKEQVFKVVLSLVLVAFAIARLFYYEALSTRMDLVFLSLVLAVFLLWMIPWEQLWERLGELSVGGVGISLQHPDVQAAIGHISFDEEHLQISGSSEKQVRDRLRRQLKVLEGELQTVRGSKVLWIDDHPETILGERRLLRALGIDITPARSSKVALDILKNDNDFDLIITDVYREGRGEGVNFVVELGKHKDERIKSLPIIFYAAYDREDLVEYTRPALKERHDAEISNAVDELIPKVIRMLSEERRNPITVTAKKTPTTDPID
jgi:CheY-like chemotaxis protein